MYRLTNALILFLANTFYSQSIDKQQIENFIDKVRTELHLQTGLSVGVVIGNEVIFTNGYGFNNIEQRISTTPDSPYYIASSTKSFTAALVELLSEKDTLNIDKPISHYLPELQFENENLNSDQISIRDLLTHRSGILSIPSVVRTAYTGQHTFDKMIEVYQTARFTFPEFKYSNDGYVITSLILDNMYTKSWQELMKENIFQKLEMDNTSCKISDFDPDDLRAYNTHSGEVEEIPFLKADNTMHAAGGIVSTANDLCNWLVSNLNDGSFKGKQILSKRKLSEMHSSQVGCSVSFWEYKRFAYGLGWYLSDYNGELLIHHFGGYAGARSHISFMPEHNIGVVALTNDDGDGFFVVDLVADYIYNMYLGKDADAIAKREIDNILKNMKKEDGNTKEKNEIPTVVSKYSDEELVGTYNNEEFGTINIINDNGLYFQFGNMGAEMVPVDEQSFLVSLAPFDVKIAFEKENEMISNLIFNGPTKIVFAKK